MDWPEQEDWNGSDADGEDGGDQSFYYDDVSVISTPESTTSDKAVQRPEWWQNVPVETRNAVREAELFIFQNPERRHEVSNEYVIWDDVHECLEANVHSTALSQASSAARKSAILQLPVVASNQSPFHESVDNSPYDLFDSDDGPTELCDDSGPVTHPDPPVRRAILEVNDSSSSPEPVRPVFRKDNDAKSRSMHLRHAGTILSDEELESLPSPKSIWESKSDPKIISPRHRSASVLQHNNDVPPSTPEPRAAIHTNQEGYSSDESPMFISPVRSLEDMNTYPARISKEAKRSASEVLHTITPNHDIDQLDSDSSVPKIERRGAPITSARAQKRRHEDQPGEDSRASKVSRKTAPNKHPMPSNIYDDLSDRRNASRRQLNILSSSDSSEFEILKIRRKQPLTQSERRYRKYTGSNGVITGRRIQASESPVSSEESPNTKAAREKVKAANKLKNKKRKQKKEGVLHEAAHMADQPREKLYAPREELEKKGLRAISRTEGVHATYDKDKEYYRHDKHIRLINTTNRAPPPPERVVRSLEDRERSVSYSSELESPTNEQDLPPRMLSGPQQRNGRRQSISPQLSLDRQQYERSQFQRPPRHSQANPPPPPPGARHGFHRSFNDQRYERSNRQQQQQRHSPADYRNQGPPPPRRQQNSYRQHPYGQQSSTQGRPSHHSSGQLSSTQFRRSGGAASQQNTYSAAPSRLLSPGEEAREFEELKEKLREEADNLWWKQP